MPLSISSERKQLIEHMFECLESPSRELTKWESDFIESVKESYSVWTNLTERQFETLERIYAEKTS